MVRTGYKDAGAVKKILIENQKQIVEEMNSESYQVYTLLHEQLHKGSIETNGLFKFVYRSFYNLDNPSVTDEFEQRYFELLEKERLNTDRPNITEITHQLYQVKNRNGNPSMQFPFVMNMLHIKNPYFPNFESNVVDLFSFSTSYHLQGFNKKMKRSIEQYRHLHETYQQLLVDQEIIGIINQLDQKFNDRSFKKLPAIKKIDMIVNQAATILS
ncbi:hypothetical protein GH741_14960 [Aquibacillus halophilus]|uniref:Uncharacterized protein n=1 Tax=Aquibacillus halophilus TaxID=930132 RepID=A0A6A8DJK9_9BACI|nr:hypothetical protein [Aquibacillus halophilus]MRH43941.1 hypothetical protein [Aquibacillus halophilus]